MTLYRNTRWHLVGSLLTAAGLAAILAVSHFIGPGWAVALGSICAGVGVEVYQKVRKEGTPSPRDAALSAVVGVVAGLLYELCRFWMAT